MKPVGTAWTVGTASWTMIGEFRLGRTISYGAEKKSHEGWEEETVLTVDVYSL